MHQQVIVRESSKQGLGFSDGIDDYNQKRQRKTISLLRLVARTPDFHSGNRVSTTLGVNILSHIRGHTKNCMAILQQKRRLIIARWKLFLVQAIRVLNKSGVKDRRKKHSLDIAARDNRRMVTFVAIISRVGQVSLSRQSHKLENARAELAPAIKDSHSNSSRK